MVSAYKCGNIRLFQPGYSHIVLNLHHILGWDAVLPFVQLVRRSCLCLENAVLAVNVHDTVQICQHERKVFMLIDALGLKNLNACSCSELLFDYGFKNCTKMCTLVPIFAWLGLTCLFQPQPIHRTVGIYPCDNRNVRAADALSPVFKPLFMCHSSCVCEYFSIHSSSLLSLITWSSSFVATSTTSVPINSQNPLFAFILSTSHLVYSLAAYSNMMYIYISIVFGKPNR